MRIKTLSSEEQFATCFTVVTKRGYRYGKPCKNKLARRNSKGDLSGVFECRKCKSSYEVENNKITLISTKGK